MPSSVNIINIKQIKTIFRNFTIIIILIINVGKFHLFIIEKYIFIILLQNLYWVIEMESIS